MDIADICSSPQLFAAYHVLHRLLVPRHSPYALSSLIFLTKIGFFLKICFSQFFLVILVYLIFHLYIFQCAKIILKSLDLSLVGSNGIEPSTSRLSGVRSNHLSYEPILSRVLSSSSYFFCSSLYLLMCLFIKTH